MTFDPSTLAMEDLLQLYRSRTAGSVRTSGQYRAEIFPASEAQAEMIRRVMSGSSVPLARPGSRETIFWPAEAYHQKYRLRRRLDVVSALTEALGDRWDEHVYATKLNASREAGFDLEPWLAEVPTIVAEAWRLEE